MSQLAGFDGSMIQMILYYIAKNNYTNTTTLIITIASRYSVYNLTECLKGRGYSNYNNGETFPLVAAFPLYNLRQAPRRNHVLLDARPSARARIELGKRKWLRSQTSHVRHFCWLTSYLIGGLNPSAKLLVSWDHPPISRVMIETYLNTSPTSHRSIVVPLLVVCNLQMKLVIVHHSTSTSP